MRVINVLEVQGEMDVLRRIKKMLFTGNKVNFESIVSSMNNTESDWNTWSIRNWGTKKNATDGYCEFDEVESGTFARIVFTTEDTAPDKVVEKLSTFFPENKFCLSWASLKGGSPSHRSCGPSQKPIQHRFSPHSSEPLPRPHPFLQ